jgi:ribosomal protein S18 acetylase RimI-like enzyme
LEQTLHDGETEPDALGGAVLYRLVRPEDDVEAITRMLHAAYRPLADRGMRYYASFQDAAVTRERMGRGETIVALAGGLVVGTVTLRPHSPESPAAHYADPGVFSFGQFAVDPGSQRRGIGSRLLALVEQRARDMGAMAIALDTSEHAEQLIRWYESCGYSFVEYVQWDLDIVNYRSVILSKDLG